MTDSFFKNENEEKPGGEVPEFPDESGESGQSENYDRLNSDEGRIAAIISYIPFLCFVPLLSMKENKEARFHARQGVVIFLIEVLAVLFLIDQVSDFVFKAILIVAVVFSIAGIYFALQGKNYKLPIIGDLADKAKL